jgi:hypothetical protein
MPASRPHDNTSPLSAELSGFEPPIPTGNRLPTTLGIRARLNSIGNRAKAASSSVLTLQARDKIETMSAQHSTIEDESDESGEESIKEEEEERLAEEQELLDRKLNDLQRMMTNEGLGLVSIGNKGNAAERGRNVVNALRPSMHSRSTSQSISSSSSPQGSIPEIPSPPTDSQPESPVGRHMSPMKASSPLTLSPRSAIGQSNLRYGRLAGPAASEHGSNQGSEASSFSDISGE